MAAAQADLVIEQGATFTQSFKWTDSNGAPIPISGYSARMQIRQNQSSPTALVSLTTSGGGIQIAGATGTVEIRIEASVTANLSFSSAVYDLELVAPDGITVYRLVQGSVTLSKEVTR